MNLKYGSDKDNPGVRIDLTPEEVCLAVEAFLVSNGVFIRGPRRVTVNSTTVHNASVSVEDTGSVETYTQVKLWPIDLPPSFRGKSSQDSA